MNRTHTIINGKGGGLAPTIAACYYKKSAYNFLFAPQNSSHSQPAVKIEYDPNTPPHKL